MDIIVYGAHGVMGKNVLKAISEAPDCRAVAAVSRSFGVAGGDGAGKTAAASAAGAALDPAYNDVPCFPSLEAFGGTADVLIEFSNREALPEILSYCRKMKIPAVIASTGHTPEGYRMMEDASKEVPVFQAGNTSVGVAVVCDLVRRAAAAFPGADIEIIEKHHNRKKDVPSGTALMIADSIKEARPDATYNIGRHENGRREPGEIGIHSIRLGNEVGTHEVIISTGYETVTIKHESENRMLFAEGALKAAAWLVTKPAGLYHMADMTADM